MGSDGIYLIIGLYHFSKPNKSRVVFACTAKYIGRSINTELLVGPGLTNQIIDILFRFRQGKTAFVADIEKMFFRFWLAKKIEFAFMAQEVQKLINQEMCMHVFDGTSSPSCCSYVLKRTSIDGDQFGKSTTETLQDNFYMDDLLKSLDNEWQAIKLIKNVKRMCASGGFKLSKF